LQIDEMKLLILIRSVLAARALLWFAIPLICIAAASQSPLAAAQPTATQTQSAGGTADVVIPDFWDPRRRVERPPPGTVQALRFVTTDDFPPFNFIDSEGHLTGFNVDLARAICSELAIPCTIQAREFGDLAGRVTSKAADAAIAGIAITADARQKLDFSDVYMRTPGRFVVRKNETDFTPTPAGLKGKTIGVVEHSAHEAYLAAMFPEVARKLYPTPDAAREALAKGEIDAHFGDGLQLGFWLQSEASNGCCMFAGGPYLEQRFFGQGYAIAVAKGATDTKRALNAALQAIYEKGVFAELYLRYFPVGFY
jgi:polar amino acid transport system substrate-binding protein